jgi:AraC-like DNA-binding protein
MEKINVLIVEDDFIIALDIKEILEESGLQVISIVTNYNDAINILQHKTPDLVIIDVKLCQSVNDGIDLGNYLLHQNIIPFIYITSVDDKHNINRIIESRPNGFIAKPFKKIDLQITVNLTLHKFKFKKIDYISIENPIKEETPYFIKNVINYIHLNLDKKILLNDLVKLTRWKKHHFIRIFNEYIGITPYNYILNAKIKHAKILLNENQLKLEEIAYNLGFQSYINFSRTFKNHTQITPNQFRIQSTIKNKHLKQY